MDILKLVRVKNGELDVAKLAAATAHLAMFAAFVRLQVYPGGDFTAELWMIYGGFAIAHDGFNRVTAMRKDTQDKKIEAATDAPQSTPMTVTVTSGKESQP